MTSSDNDPQSTGTEPQAIGEPLAGGVDIPNETFEFPISGGVPGTVAQGPLGSQSQAPPTDRPPELGWARTPGVIRTRSFQMTTFLSRFNRIEVSRPTLFLPISTSVPDGAEAISGTYFPGNLPSEIGLASGLGMIRMAFWCWSTGVWFAAFNGSGSSDRITYAEIPVDNQAQALSMMEGSISASNPSDGLSADQVLAAAVGATLFSINASESLMLAGIELSNVGAGTLRYSDQAASASATTGRFLAAGATVILGPGSHGFAPFGVSRLTGFSTAGTTVSAKLWRRSLL